MLYLKNTPIDKIVSMSEAIDAIEEALKEVALGSGFELPRRRIHHPNRMIFGLLPGSVRGAMGAYLQTDLDRRLHHESVILCSVESGEPLILFQNCSINELRTGAAGGIGAKHLARKDANRVAVIGSAVHSQMQLRAVATVRNLARVSVYSPNPAHREEFAKKMSVELKLEVKAESSAEAATNRADIVIMATNSKTPVMDGSAFPQGVHITSIANGDKTRTRQEIDNATLRRAGKIFVTSKQTVQSNESDLFRAARDGIIAWNDVREISQLLLGKVDGRQTATEVTLFKLQGTGIMDVAVGLRAYELLKDSSIVQRL